MATTLEKDVLTQNKLAVNEATTPESSRVKLIMALLALYIIWGSTYLAIRFALEGFPPFLMAGVRFLIAGALLYGFLRIRGVRNPTRQQWKGAAIVGCLLLVVGNGGVVFAEQWVASGVAALGVASVPLWAALFAGIWGNWPTRQEWLGSLLGLLGVALLSLGSGLSLNPIGTVTVLVAATGWAIGSVWSRYLSLPGGLMSSAVEMLVGGAVLMVLGFFFDGNVTLHFTSGAMLAVVYLVIFGSLLGFTAYGYLLQTVKPALATSYAYVNPMVAVGLGVLFDNESLTVAEIAAMGLILAGVVLVTLKFRKR